MKLDRKLKIFLIILAVACGFGGSRMIYRAIESQNDYQRDFISEYVFAKALRKGLNPYLPISELAEKTGVTASATFPHPTPHTPILGILCFPLAWINYETAIRLWLVLNITCLFGAMVLLLPNTKSIIIGLLAFAALGWRAVFEDLLTGQINLILLLLIAASWRTLKADRPLLAGIFIGTTAALKPIYLPIILFLVIRKQWKPVAAATITFAAAQVVPILVLGWQTVFKYYTQIAPAVADRYKASAINLSLWSAGWRLFVGSDSPILAKLNSTPPFYSETAGRLTAYGLVLLVFIISLVLVKKVRSLETGLGIMVCACLLMSPITWGHYMVVLILPISMIVRDLKTLGLPRRKIIIAGYAILPQLDVMAVFEDFLRRFSVNDVVPFGIMLINMVPTISVIAIGLFSYHLAKQVEQQFSV